MSSRLTRLLICGLLCAGFLSRAQAQESLFIAKVERITLEPRGGQYCPDLCAENGSRMPDGGTRVCFSNDGGCEHIDYVVSKVLFGNTPLGSNKLDTRIGEWGGTHLPLSNQPILVHMKPGFTEWVSIVVKDGQQRAQVAAFRHGILDSGIDLRTLVKDGEDSVPLDSLLERLTAPQR